jgi:hypothetical protein
MGRFAFPVPDLTAQEARAQPAIANQAPFLYFGRIRDNKNHNRVPEALGACCA